MTLLEIVTEILSDMSSDEIESITDTEESEQIARIVISTYRSMMANRNWPHQKELTKLVAGDVDKFVYMATPDDCKEIVSISYNKIRNGETRNRFKEIEWLENDAFLRYVQKRNNDETNVVLVTDESGVELAIRNDKQPEYYTSFDDTNIVFDSSDSGVESALANSKTQVVAYINSEDLAFSDSAVPNVPAEALAALIEESKSRASLKLAQEADIKSEQDSARQQRWLSRKAWKVEGGVKYPNYGRRRGRKSRYGRDATFTQDY